MNLKKLQDEALCTPEMMKCVDEIKLNSSVCIKSCNGLMITGYSKFQFEDYSKKEIKKTLDAYNDYKKHFNTFRGIQG